MWGSGWWRSVCWKEGEWCWLRGPCGAPSLPMPWGTPWCPRPSLCPGDPAVPLLIPQLPRGTACREERLGTWWTGADCCGCSEAVLRSSRPSAPGCVIVSKCPVARTVGRLTEHGREPVLGARAPEPPRGQGKTSATAPAAPGTVHHTRPKLGWLSPAPVPRLVGQGWAQPPFPLPVPPVPRLLTQPFVPHN